MKKRSFIPVVFAAALAGAAVPAFAFDGSDNPGTEHQPTVTQQNTISDGAPYNGEDNPGLGREEARAIGRDECGDFKQNFADNKQQFGKCVAAVAMDIRNEEISAREACNAKELSHQRSDGEVRSDFKACVLAAREGEVDAEV
jgi:hypothetical protein